MSTSLLLTEKSTVTFIIGTDRSTTVTLDSGSATFAPPLATTYKGVVTWTLATDSKNTILGHKVALSLQNITVPITTSVYTIPDSGSGSISGSEIAKITMGSSHETPLCVADGNNLSITGDAHYTDSYGNHYLSSGGSSVGPGVGYTCKCEFNAVQTKTSGLIY